jgi:hypothetical protein
MKSPMILSMYADDPTERDRYTDLQVLRSAAGYYVGTLYRDPEFDGHEVPGSRDTFEYYGTAEEAGEVLKRIESGKYTTRMTP